MGKVCTFFGHRDCPYSIRSMLREVLLDLIENHSVDLFYVGCQGTFDAMARDVLRELSQVCPHIQYAVILDHLPVKKDEFSDYSDTLLPEGIEKVHPRYAIVWRNRWMLRHADYVVTYVLYRFGGAARFAELAERQKKTVIRLADIPLSDAKP